MIAPMVLDGPMTGEWFLAYTRQILAPTLVAGDVVILDNLPAHKGAAVRETIEAAGARLLFLPPYSPDFNPIESAFAKALLSLSKGSRPCSVRPPPAPSNTSGASSATFSTRSHPTNAPTTSQPRAMTLTDRKML